MEAQAGETSRRGRSKSPQGEKHIGRGCTALVVGSVRYRSCSQACARLSRAFSRGRSSVAHARLLLHMQKAKTSRRQAKPKPAASVPAPTNSDKPASASKPSVPLAKQLKVSSLLHSLLSTCSSILLHGDMQKDKPYSFSKCARCVRAQSRACALKNCAHHHGHATCLFGSKHAAGCAIHSSQHLASCICKHPVLQTQSLRSSSLAVLPSWGRTHHVALSVPSASA